MKTKSRYPQLGDLSLVEQPSGHFRVRGSRPTSGPKPKTTPAAERDVRTVRFTVPGSAVGYVRMTQRDRWQQRPCVLRYRDFRDRVRKAAGILEPAEYAGPVRLLVRVFVAIPETCAPALRVQVAGQPHLEKPDSDNFLKGISDALIANDQVVYDCQAQKFWDDGQGPRVEVELTA